MADTSDPFLAAASSPTFLSRLRVLALVLVPLAAILFQVYVPLFFPFLAYLEMPLLVTVYYSLVWGRPVRATFYGAAIGITQDSLSENPLGMFGITKTLVGYFTAAVAQRFDVDNAFIRFAMAFFLFFFHQFFYWVLSDALLGLQMEFDAARTILSGALNAVVSIPLFRILDKL